MTLEADRGLSWEAAEQYLNDVSSRFGVGLKFIPPPEANLDGHPDQQWLSVKPCLH